MPKGKGWRQAKKEEFSREEIFAQALVPKAEQPYEVPGNWVWVRLGGIGKVKGGKRLPKGHSLIEEKTKYPYIRVTDFINNSIDTDNIKHLKEETQKLIKSYTISSNDIYISIAGTIGKVGIVPEILDGSNLTENAAKIVITGDVEKRYLLYLLHSDDLQTQIASNTLATTQAKLALFRIESLCVPLPPLAEQHRIVNRIESLFEKLDRAKALVQSALDSFETRRAAILHKAFTGELTAEWRGENGVGIESWGTSKLGTIANIKSSKRIFAEEYRDNGVPFFRSSEVVELYDEGYTEPKYFISRERYEEIKREYGVPAFGDLLVTSVGTIGKTWVVDDREFYYKDGNLTQVEKSEALDIRYLQYFISSGEFKNMISDTVAGSAYNALTIVKFKNIPIPLPILLEQQEIVRILDSLFEKEKAALELADTVTKIDHMKKAILARAFRGELGTNEVGEESAVGLLQN